MIHSTSPVRPLAPLAVATAACCLVVAATESALAQRGPMRVGVDTVRIEPLSQTVPVIGRIIARQSGSVTAAVAGPVEAVNVAVGDRVARGDVLAMIEQRWIMAERDDRQATVDRFKAEVRSAEASAALARQGLERLQRLRGSAAFNKARYDDAAQEASRARADIARARAQLAGAEAQLQISTANLQRATVAAPYAGVVTVRHTEAGDYLGIGAPVVDMVNDRTVEIEADVPYGRLSGLTPGRTVSIAFSGGELRRAEVRAIVPVENPLTRTQAVRFSPRFSWEEQATAINQSVTVDVPTGAPRDIATVHKDAILRGPRGDSVYVVRDGKAVPTPVQLGQAIGNRLEVLSGLAEGDPVIVRGNERIRPNQDVTHDGAS